MTRTARFYWYAKCSTCRAARAALLASGIGFTERDFFKTPLSASEIRQIAVLSSADQMFSWKSPSARDLRPRRDRLSGDEMIRLMASEPRLIRRPILVRGDQVTFGYDAGVYGSIR